MSASLRVFAVLAVLAMMLGAVPAALAAGPVRISIDLDDPQIDIDETAWASDLCGFAIDAQVSGHILGFEFPDNGRSVFALNVYNQKATYRSVATGAVLRLRDIGPDRFYTKDGRAYVAVTGRSTTGSGVIGQVVIDLETGEIVHTAGNDVGFFYDGFCEALS
jgi:hypothetical protein